MAPLRDRLGDTRIQECLHDHKHRPVSGTILSKEFQAPKKRVHHRTVQYSTGVT